MTKIAFIDDQQDKLDPARELLVSEGYEVERHRDGDFALAVFQRRKADLVVINLSGQNAKGMALLERIREKWTVPVVMLSAAKDEIDEILCLRLGADDYIDKPVSPRLLSARINCLLRRHTNQTESLNTQTGFEQAITLGDLSMDPTRHEVIWKEKQVILTVTEFNLLMCLARRPGVVKNRDRLMSEVYSDTIFVDDRTIDSHVKRIRKKIRSIDPEFDAIETLYGIGYRFVMPKKALFLLQSTEQRADKRFAA
ncbi:MAG: response regulator transcription factor [Rhodobacterales bacterium]|nr:response regulator transcription factor [Rhodobacterales bacterium]